MEKTKQNKIYFLLAIGVTVISTSGILIKVAKAGPLVIAFYRMLFTILLMTPLLKKKSFRDQLVYFKEARLILVGFFLASHFFLWTSAFEYTSVSNAVIFMALQPLFTYLLEYFFAREDLRPGIISGIIFAMIGSIIISIGSLSTLFTKVWGDILAIIAAFFAAAYLFTGRSLRERLDYFPYLFIIYTYATLFLGILALFTGQEFSGYDWQDYLVFLGLALGPTLIGHSILNYSVRILPATLVSLTILLEPILTTILAWVILGEGINRVTLMGGILILFGIYRAIIKNRQGYIIPGPGHLRK